MQPDLVTQPDAVGPSDRLARARANPAFAELEQKRRKFSWTLALLMLVIYFGFILLVAFAKPVMATKIGAVVTFAFPLGLAVILSAIVITGVYVVRANDEFDRLTSLIRKDAK